MTKAEGFGLSAFAFAAKPRKLNKNKAQSPASELFAVASVYCAVASV
jgi:hypothetical protein